MRKSALLPVVLVMAVSVASADQTFDYDNNGNLVRRTVDGVPTDFIFDPQDKLIEVRQGSSILVRYQYDFQGRMILKIGLDGVRQYVYDGQIHPVAEYDGDGGLVALYSWAGSRLNSVSFRAGASLVTYYPSFDALGSVVALTDMSGAVVARYHYDAWGNARFPQEFQANPNRFGYTGHRWQPETNLYSAGARQFDPGLGRFLSQDPFPSDVTNPFTLHRYVYARNAPTRYTDPYGLWEWDTSLGGKKTDRELRALEKSKTESAETRAAAKDQQKGREAFRSALRQARNAEDQTPRGEDRARLTRALDAYGEDPARQPNQAVEDVRVLPNGMTSRVRRRVLVGSEVPENTDARAPGAASHRLNYTKPDPTSPNPQEELIEADVAIGIRQSKLEKGGDELVQIVSHEGSHAPDRKAYIEGVIEERRAGGVRVAPLPSRTVRETELDAYRVSATIAHQQRLAAEAAERAKSTGGTSFSFSAKASPDRNLTYSVKGQPHTIYDTTWADENRAALRDAAIIRYLEDPDGMYSEKLNDGLGGPR